MSFLGPDGNTRAVATVDAYQCRPASQSEMIDAREVERT